MLLAFAEKTVGVPSCHLANRDVPADFYQLRPNRHERSDDRWRFVIDAHARSDSLLVVLEKIDEHLPGGQFHMMHH